MPHRTHRPQGSWWSFWIPFAALLLIAFVAQRALFQTPLDAWGDSAVNGLSILRAERFEQLVGNYSRVGFHHPGPGFMYILAAGELLFHDALHVAPAPYNGQLLGASVYVSAAMASVCLVVFRNTRSTSATLVTFGFVFVFAARMPLFGQDWFPFLYVSAFLVMLVSGAVVAAGRTGELPLFLLAAGLLAHGHASFLMFVGVTVLVVGAAWWWWHRRQVRTELAEHRRASWLAVAVIVVMCLPVLADFVLHFPGQWPKYARFALNGERDPRSVGDVLDFVGQYWTALPWPLYVVAGLVGGALLASERDRRCRVTFACAYGMVVLQSLLFIYYGARGVDHLIPVEIYAYVGYFYRAVPLLLVLTSAIQVVLRIERRIGADDAVRIRARTVVPAAVLAVAAVGVTLATTDIGRLVPAGHTYADGAEAIAGLDLRRGRVVVLDNRTGEVWATSAGLGLALSRADVDWCMEGENAVPIVFGDHMCTRRESRTGMHVRLTDLEVPAGKVVVWHDGPADPRLSPGTVQAYVNRG